MNETYYENILSNLDTNTDNIENLSEVELESLLQLANKYYRDGIRKISDNTYDVLMNYFAKKYPSNSYFNQDELEIEPELIEGKTAKLPQKMLSTQKAYTLHAIENWIMQCEQAATVLKISLDDIHYKITPKLDGYAAYWDNEKQTLYTRGNGTYGTDITHAYHRGLKSRSNSVLSGAGEIVVDKNYFKTELAEYFENSRNIISGIIKESELDSKIQDALDKDYIKFKQFHSLNSLILSKDEILNHLESLFETVQNKSSYDTDGIVLEIIDHDIKKYMGATNHHNRWQIAYKKNIEYHKIEVIDILDQTSKDGTITPVVLLKPTKVSGVTISKATGHNYGNIIKKKIGKGAIVSVCRSGLVIPYIDDVIVEAIPNIPTRCPSCGSETELNDIHLKCTNTIDCPAQIEGTISYFFNTIEIVDGFGPAVISNLHRASNVTSVLDIYKLSQSEFYCMFGGGKTAVNLYEQLQRSKKLPIEDWKFLAAFSIRNVGNGGCEKILKHFKLKDIFSLTKDDIIKIDGFGEKTANSLITSLQKIKPQFDELYNMNFNLIETSHEDEHVESSISRKTIVFTGTMSYGTRKEFEDEAKKLGAIIGSGVTSKTNILVTGDKMGATKINAANKFGVKILTEIEYCELIGKHIF